MSAKLATPMLQLLRHNPDVLMGQIGFALNSVHNGLLGTAPTKLDGRGAGRGLDLGVRQPFLELPLVRLEHGFCAHRHFSRQMFRILLCLLLINKSVY
jgi:hypothetical protein